MFCQYGDQNMASQNNDFKENLITAVQAYPFLYDHTRADYKDSVKKENGWQAVAFQCCSDGKKWQNLLFLTTFTMNYVMIITNQVMKNNNRGTK